MTPIIYTDYYKTEHFRMYPEGTTKIVSNLTPRKSRIEGINSIVVFGFQHFIKRYLLGKFQTEFFGKPWDEIEEEYKFAINTSTDHIKALHELGYLPLEIRGLPEGTRCPIRIPCMVIWNTKPEFYWLVNYLETLMSCQLWQPITSATIATEYFKLLSKYAYKTTGSTNFVQWQGHDFSMRGMSSLESAILSGMAHLAAGFTGTDTIPAIYALRNSYGGKGLIGASVPATEHSVMCMGLKDDEMGTFERLLDLYPTGILSVVSDTWDLWKVITEFLPPLKDKILARDGKLVIRPDSGDPVDIICGTVHKDSFKDLSKYYKHEDSPVNHPEFFEDSLLEEVRENTAHGVVGPCEWESTYQINGKLYKAKIHNIQWNRYDKQYYYIEMYDKAKITVEEVPVEPKHKGVVELLWDIFGGTIIKGGDGNDYKVLDPHIGTIYGDSISLDRAKQICERLKTKGFASTNVVLGIGSYTYQFNTRDTFGFAVKATYGEVSGIGPDGSIAWTQAREIWKDPITDDGTKKSAKGLIYLGLDRDMNIYMEDQVSWEKFVSEDNLLQPIFRDGKLLINVTLNEIRSRIKSYL